MAIEKYIVVSGLNGVHKLVTTRSNGVILLDSAQGKNRFVPAKSTDVTPLGMISVYTETEEGAVPLKDVFVRMRDQAGEHAVPHFESTSTELRNYFKAVMPEHDDYKVRIADIKKMVKWYHYMVDKKIIEDVLADDQAIESSNEIIEA